MHSHLEIAKTVKVSDPENFYKQDTVEVVLHTLPPYRGSVRVRIVICTIDDKSFAIETEVNSLSRESIISMYNHYKTWIYDKMPEEISLAWLYEHGFLPV